MTLAEFFEHWLDHIQPNRSTTTVRGYKVHIKRINGTLGRFTVPDHGVAAMPELNVGQHAPIEVQVLRPTKGGSALAGPVAEAPGWDPLSAASSAIDFRWTVDSLAARLALIKGGTVRTAVLDGRLHLRYGDGFVDVAMASNGRWGPDPQGVFDHWDAFREWGATVQQGRNPPEQSTAMLGPPVPRPRQVFAVGLNYREHAEEGHREVPTSPLIFTKFPSCLTGPLETIFLPSDAVDFEAELVVVIGRRCESVKEGEAWSHVAGLMAGQDISERRVQRIGPTPQWSLGKSFRGFGPVGPCLVTTDEFTNVDDLELGCRILGGEVLQLGRTSQMIFAVPELLARISYVCTLYPGDLLFTGTPAGVGVARTPPRFLADGEELVTHVEGIGELRNRLTSVRPKVM